VKIAVLGLGYVGTVTASCLAAAGHEVVGVDTAHGKVQQIMSGNSPVVEPGLDAVIRDVVSSGRLTASTDVDAVRGCDVVIVCVGTPSRPGGAADLTFVEAVSRELGGVLAEVGQVVTVVLRSTVPPGTTVASVTGWLGSLPHVRVVFCPEFLRVGSAIADFHSPPFTVVGVERPGDEVDVVRMLDFLTAPVHVVNTGVAESVKFASNAFHALKVTFANEMARTLDSLGVDPRPVMDLFVADTDLNISSRYLRPGFAFGGSCLPKDLRALTALADAHDVDVPMFRAILESNATHVALAVAEILRTGARRIALLGLTFKPRTDDLRESPQVALAADLIAAGVDVVVYDPLVVVDELVGANLEGILASIPDLHERIRATLPDAIDGADLVVLAHIDQLSFDSLLATAPTPVLDIGNSLTPRDAQRLRDTRDVVGLAW
jgi:GDP-mannose 6-dehydrogenase